MAGILPRQVPSSDLLKLFNLGGIHFLRSTSELSGYLRRCLMCKFEKLLKNSNHTLQEKTIRKTPEYLSNFLTIWKIPIPPKFKNSGTRPRRLQAKFSDMHCLAP